MIDKMWFDLRGIVVVDVTCSAHVVLVAGLYPLALFVSTAPTIVPLFPLSRAFLMGVHAVLEGGRRSSCAL
jgi:hypothetical protein